MLMSVNSKSLNYIEPVQEEKKNVVDSHLSCKDINVSLLMECERTFSTITSSRSVKLFW